MSNSIQIKKAKIQDTNIIVDLISKLLNDFNHSGSGSFNIDQVKLTEVTEDFIKRTNCAAFIAYNADKQHIGLLTVSHSFAIYNDGDFGVITELYVDKDYRSKGIGKLLLESVYEFAKSKDWKKIEVGAPDSDSWPRTTAFYKENGFVEKGPKLRIEL